jgi:hypothetical protein
VDEEAAAEYRSASKESKERLVRSVRECKIPRTSTAASNHLMTADRLLNLLLLCA